MTSLVEEFKQLCSDNNFDTKSFAEFAGVNSKNPQTIQNVINNFEYWKDQFIERSNAAA